MSLEVRPKSIAEKYDPDCAVLELTLSCNFRCIHCGGSAGTKRKDELTRGEIGEVARDLKRIGFKRVSLIGGEPFIRPEWFELACLIKSEGLKLTYVTNGSLFPRNKQLVQRVLETEPQVIGFSLDGGTPETQDKIRRYPGAFAGVMASLDIFCKEGVDVSIITAVNKLNVAELPRIRDLILGKGIGWQIQFCDHNGRRFPKELFVSKEEYIKVAEFIHNCATQYTWDELPIAGADDIGYFSERFPLCSINRHCWDGCKGGRTNVGIQSNGNVKGCDSLPDQYIEGNIRERSLYDIWNDPDSFAYSRNFSENMLQGFCRQCRHGSVCKGGCVDIAHAITGHAFENTYCLFKHEQETPSPIVPLPE